MNSKKIINFVKRIDNKVILITLGLIFLNFIIINKFFYENYLNKEYNWKGENKKLEVARELIALKTEETKLDDLLFKASDIGSTLSYISSFFEKHSILITNIDPQKISKQHGIFKREVLVFFTAKYDKLLNLLNEIEADKKLLVIENLSIKFRKKSFQEVDNIDDPDLEVSLKISICSYEG